MMLWMDEFRSLFVLGAVIAFLVMVVAWLVLIAQIFTLKSSAPHLPELMVVSLFITAVLGLFSGLLRM